MLLSPRQVADEVGLSYRTVLRAIEDGDLVASRLGRSLRVQPEDLNAWINRGQVYPPGACAKNWRLEIDAAEAERKDMFSRTSYGGRDERRGGTAEARAALEGEVAR